MNTAVTPQQDTSLLFPVGRVVQGDLYEPQTKDNQGNPLTIKTGPNAGKPRVNYFFAIALPKTPGATHWAHEQWGARIWALGHSWWPAGQGQSDRFAWKIEDGDDARPNQNGRVNNTREGFPGHWVIQLGSSYAPKIFDNQGNPLLQPGLVKRGYWVEVLSNLASNENAQNPGIYINHSMVAYRAPGAEIVSGPDPKSVGFGKSALPPGVTENPAGNTAHMPVGVPSPGIPGAPPVPGAPVAHVPYNAPGIPGAVAMPAPAAPQPTPVAPQPNFLHAPIPGAAPPVPAAPTMAAPPPSVVCPLGAPMGYKMANLNGARFEAFKAQGWNDAQLLQAGHMVRL